MSLTKADRNRGTLTLTVLSRTDSSLSDWSSQQETSSTPPLRILMAKRKKDNLVFNDCEQYEGFNGGTLHSEESVFLLAYGVCTFKLFNMIVASCFSQLCFQVRVHGESWIRYLGTKWAVTSWKVIKAANEAQLPLGYEQIILRVPLIQISDSCTRWIMGLMSNDYKGNRILLEMALD